jgi:Sec-independent protein secretion pathway component TatC
LGFGIALQLPTIMYLLSLSGLTGSKFWQKTLDKQTPGGNGVTMWFVALPMIALYAVGIIAIRRNDMSAYYDKNYRMPLTFKSQPYLSCTYEWYS